MRRTLVKIMLTFQPTRPRGARLDGDEAVRRSDLFQPTRPRGARHLLRRLQVAPVVFQPTRPRGARRCGLARSPARRWSFNPRAHAGRDFTAIPSMAASRMFQPTRPRGARPVDAPVLLAACGVSTHAPTRGATSPRSPAWPRHGCFNPRAHAGRDLSMLQFFSLPAGFQPTRPRGARPCVGDSGDEGRSVSTHAPTRGATRGRPLWRRAARVSTHAPTRGATEAAPPSRCIRSMFQPTRPRGARLLRHHLRHRRWRVSTHAPTRGATYSVIWRSHSPAVFQPTRPRGARRVRSKLSASSANCFNPRAHAGRDLVKSVFSPRFRCFNPRAHAGRDTGSERDAKLPFKFQPTRPRGERRWRAW